MVEASQEEEEAVVAEVEGVLEQIQRTSRRRRTLSI